MEIAGISHLYESSANNKSAVASAINKNKAALTSAIKDRLADDENMDLHDRVERLLTKTAIEAGLPKESVEKYPWMEGFAVPGDSSPAKDLKNLQDFLEDALDNPEITQSTTKSTGTEKPKVSTLSAAQATSAFKKAINQGVYILDNDALNRVFLDIMDARPANTRLEGWNDFRWLYTSTPVVVKDGSNVYLLYLEEEGSAGVLGIVQVKNNKLVQDVYVAKSPKTGQYTDARSGSKQAIDIRDRLVAKVAQAGIANSKIREALGDQPNLNPALNGEVRVPECSQIQQKLSKYHNK